ncbi:oxidoreductase [Actinacidiphila acididurans]|uniref:SDR family NAD(P)-dependent oxidoreductase n=1 Tax=Actinacidiphila acididurans TaxID=2784346 RepID=A0ABS2TQ22_9ACTN|nr:oxidoreductase [Actinacidiphila acididurans]MBM9504365.1 SDR family NAD(P)-dependent oxidoreductase [Actinacidiphila acididurans]
MTTPTADPTAPPAHWTPRAIGDLTGRTALITGGNSGIGLETARVLARHGARVVLAGRSAAKLADAVAELRAEQPDALLDTAVLDLGSLASIAATSARLAASETIDLLINNAGVMNVPERRTTTDGLELTVGTNHLGHFALTAGLMPALLRAEAGRVVTVSAIAASWRMGHLDDLMSERRYRPMAAYAKSKRANVVFTRELARRLSGTSVTALAVHPGSAVTNLQRHSEGPLSRLAIALTRRTIMGSPEGAAWPSLYAATSPHLQGGAYYAPAGRDQTSGTPKPAPLPHGADDPTEAARLWQESERLTGVAFTI